MSYGQTTTLIARSGYGSPQPGPAPMAGVLDKIGDFLKGAGTGVVNFYGQAQRDAGAAAALQQPAQPSTPSWLLPAVLVGGGVVLILLLKRPRKNPAGNQRRRRRSRRSRR